MQAPRALVGFDVARGLGPGEEREVSVGLDGRAVRRLVRECSAAAALGSSRTGAGGAAGAEGGVRGASMGAKHGSDREAFQLVFWTRRGDCDSECVWRVDRGIGEGEAGSGSGSGVSSGWEVDVQAGRALASGPLEVRVL